MSDNINQLNSREIIANYGIYGGKFAAKTIINRIENAIKVPHVLTEDEMGYLNQYCYGLNIIYERTGTSKVDHQMMAACRHIIRQIFNNMFNPLTTKTSTLICGSSEREYKMYKSNENVQYYIKCSEAKDVSRIIERIYEHSIDYYKSHQSQADDDGYNNFLKGINADFKINPHKVSIYTARNVKEVVEQFATLDQISNNMPKRIHLSPVKANVLVLEDVGYNFSETDWLELFQQTNALRAYCYGAYPDELILKDLLPDPYYNIHYHSHDSEEYMSMVYKNCRSNGYTHSYKRWRIPLVNPVLTGKINGELVTIMFEIHHQVGPMVCFSVTRTSTTKDIVSRNMNILDTRIPVKMLRLLKSFDFGNMCMGEKLYGHIPKQTHDIAREYMSTLIPSKVEVHTAAIYLRRYTRGFSNSNTSSRPDTVPIPEYLRDEYILALTLDTINLNYKRVGIIKNLNNTKPFINYLIDYFSMSFDAAWKDLLKADVINKFYHYLVDDIREFKRTNKPPSILSKIFKIVISTTDAIFSTLCFIFDLGLLTPVVAFFSYFFQDPNYYDELFVQPNYSGLQIGVIKTQECMQRFNLSYDSVVKKISSSKADVPAKPDVPSVDLEPTSYSEVMTCESGCEFCELPLDYGEQVIHCGYSQLKRNTHNFVFSVAAYDRLKNQLGVNENDPVGLAELKKKCYSVLRKPIDDTEMNHECKVFFIVGPPGSGKTRACEEIAKVNTNSLYIAPLNSLKESFKFEAETFQKAVLKRGTYDVLIFDEYTLFDSDYIRWLVNIYQPKLVYIVGDPKQITIKDDEGVPFDNYMDIKEFSVHTLTVNFRNPMSIINYMNNVHNYNLRSSSLTSTGEFMIFSRNIDKVLTDKQLDASKLNILYTRDKDRFNYNHPLAQKYGIVDKIGLISFITSVEEYKHQKTGFVIHPYEPDIITNEFSNLTYSRATADSILGCKTVRQAQGSTYNNTALYVNSNDLFIASKLDFQIVSMTRHKEKLYIICDSMSTVDEFLRLTNLEPSVFDIAVHVSGGALIESTAHVEDPVDPIIESTVVPRAIEVPGYDAYQLLRFEGMETNNPDKTRFNIVDANLKIPPNLTVSPDLWLHLDKHNVPREVGGEYYSITQGLSHKWFKTVIDELNTFVKRMAPQKEMLQKDLNAIKALCNEMVSNVFKYTKIPDYHIKVHKFFNSPEESDLMHKYLNDKKEKDYFLRITGNMYNDFTVNTITAYIKTGEKPGTMVKDYNPTSGGLLVNSMDPGFLLYWGYIYRVIEFLDRETNRTDEHVTIMTDNGVSEEKFLLSLKSKMDIMFPIKAAVVHHISDGPAMDTNHGEASQLLEISYYRTLLSGLYLPESLQDSIVTARLKKIVYGTDITTLLQYRLGSGGCATKIANEKYMFLVCFNSYLINGGTKLLINAKGDDNDIVSDRLLVKNTDMISRMEAVFPLRPTHYNSEYGEFCGYAVGSLGYYPNIKRRVTKVINATFKNYDEFCEYRESLKDWLDLVRRLGDNVIITNANCFYGGDKVKVNLLLQALSSLVSINEAQFRNYFNLESVQHLMITKSSTGNGLVVINQ